jgi:hypothetical protein
MLLDVKLRELEEWRGWVHDLKANIFSLFIILFSILLQTRINDYREYTKLLEGEPY